MISFIGPLLLWVYGNKLLGLGINDVTFGHVSVVGTSAGAVVALAGTLLNILLGTPNHDSQSSFDETYEIGS